MKLQVCELIVVTRQKAQYSTVPINHALASRVLKMGADSAPKVKVQSQKNFTSVAGQMKKEREGKKEKRRAAS